MSMSKTSGRRVLATQRQVEILNLRLQGHSYTAIGKHLGISKQAAAQSVKRALTEYREKISETLAEVVALECQRLDVLFGAHFKRALDDVESANLCLRIMERRARMLGLDNAPTFQIHSESKSIQVTFSEKEIQETGRILDEIGYLEVESVHTDEDQTNTETVSVPATSLP